MPVLPMVLVNGADGIGTGYSTSIPNYNPKDIIDNLLRMMDGQDPVPMKPWFRGFKVSKESANAALKENLQVCNRERSYHPLLVVTP